MTTDELERGMILHFASLDAYPSEHDLECSVVSSETEVTDDGDTVQECVEVCFLDAGAGYSRGEVGFVSLDSFREFQEGE
jgi:hypothetical protein